MANKSKLFVVVLALALAFTSLMVAPALADTMNLASRGYESATVTFNYSSKSTGTAEFYSTSNFQGTNWIGYCVELSQTFSSPLEIISPSSWGGTGSTNWLEAAWLIENYAPGITWLGNSSAVNYSDVTVMNTIQAVQLAVWEVIYNQDTTLNSGHYYTRSSLNSGSFKVSGYNTVGTNAYSAGTMLEALDAAKLAGGGTVSLLSGYNVVIGQSGTAQDLLMVCKTPEPATMIMAASGLGLMAWRRRRQKKA